MMYYNKNMHVEIEHNNC